MHKEHDALDAMEAKAAEEEAKSKPPVIVPKAPREVTAKATVRSPKRG